MASGFNLDTRNSILDDLFKTSVPQSNTVYLALCITEPGDDPDMSAHEVADAFDYAREAIQFDTGAAAGAISNDAACEFPAANGGSWGTVAYGAICAGATRDVDDSIMSGALTASKPIGDTDQLIFPIGGITASIAAQA